MDFQRNVLVDDPSAGLFGPGMVSYRLPKEEHEEKTIPGDSLEQFCKKMHLNPGQLRRWVYIHNAHKLHSKSEEMEAADGTRTAIPEDKLEHDSNYVYPDPLPMSRWTPNMLQDKFEKITLMEMGTSLNRLRAHNEKTDGTRLEMATWENYKIQEKFGMSYLQANAWLEMLKAQNQKREEYEKVHASVNLGILFGKVDSGSNYVYPDPLPMSKWNPLDINDKFQTGLTGAATSLSLLWKHDEKTDGTRMEMASWSLQKIQSKFRMTLVQAEAWLAMLRAQNRKREGVQEKDAAGKAFRDSLVDICGDYQLTLEQAYNLVNIHNKQRIFDKLEEMKKNRGVRTQATHREDLEATLRLFRLGDDNDIDVQVHINTDPFSDVNVKVIDGLDMDGTDFMSIVDKFSGIGGQDVIMRMSEEKDGVTLWYATGGVKSDKGVFSMTTTAELTESVYHYVLDKGIPIQETTMDLLQAHLSLSGGSYYGVEGGVSLLKVSNGIFTAKVGLEAGFGAGVKDDSIDVDVAGLDVSVGKVMGISFWGNGASIDLGKLFAF